MGDLFEMFGDLIGDLILGAICSFFSEASSGAAGRTMIGTSGVEAYRIVPDASGSTDSKSVTS